MKVLNTLVRYRTEKLSMLFWWKCWFQRWSAYQHSTSMRAAARREAGAEFLSISNMVRRFVSQI